MLLSGTHSGTQPGSLLEPPLPAPPVPENGPVAIFLDVDGTLVPLAEHPRDVSVPSSLLASLIRIRASVDGALALVSGRSLADLDRLFAPESFALVGQHGVERRDARGRLHVKDRHASLLKRLRPGLEGCAAEVPGAWIEDKGLTIALHVRGGSEPLGRLRAGVKRLLATYPELELLDGKNLVEIHPAGVDKGSAIAAFLTEPPFQGRQPMVLGDDITDESGFRVANEHQGLSIKVGLGPTRARYRLATPAAAVAWLSTLGPAS